MSSKIFWIGIGFAGQALFTARLIFQWIASERKRDAVVPVAFWWFSVLGGVTLLIYAIHLLDPVIIVGQTVGLVVYVRNLMLVDKARRRAERRRRRASENLPAEPVEKKRVQKRRATARRGS